MSPSSHVNSRRPEKRARPWLHPTTCHLTKCTCAAIGPTGHGTIPHAACSPSHSNWSEMQGTEITTAVHYTKSFIQLRELKLKISKGNYRKGGVFLVCLFWEFNNTSDTPCVTISHLQSQSISPFAGVSFHKETEDKVHKYRKMKCG